MRKLTLITLCLLIAVPVFAELKFNGAAVGAGIIMPESPWDMGFNGAGYVNLGELSKGLVFVPGLSYWAATYEEDFLLDASKKSEATLSNIAINADVHYFFNGKEEGPYAGGGLSFNMTSVEVTSPAYTVTFFGTTTNVPSESHTASDSKIGFQALGGYLTDVGNMKGFVEAKYNIISDFNTLQINVGVWFGGK